MPSACSCTEWLILQTWSTLRWTWAACCVERHPASRLKQTKQQQSVGIGRPETGTLNREWCWFTSLSDLTYCPTVPQQTFTHNKVIKKVQKTAQTFFFIGQRRQTHLHLFDSKWLEKISHVKHFMIEITIIVSCHLWDYVERSSSLTNHLITSSDSQGKLLMNSLLVANCDTLALIHLVWDCFACVLKVKLLWWTVLQMGKLMEGTTAFSISFFFFCFGLGFFCHIRIHEQGRFNRQLISWC